MRFKQFLNEAVQLADIDFSELHQIYSYVFKYDFTIDGRKYTVTFEQHDEAQDIWERFMTYHDPKTGRTHKATNLHKDMFKILGIQFGCLRTFLKGYSPNAVTFTADKADRSRAKVYEGILRRMDLATLGYSFRQADEGSDIRFYVEKN